jgi:RNA polymerase sigma factor (sigma-70 family)
MGPDARRRAGPESLFNGLGAQLPDAEQTALAVHEALEVLEQADPRLAQVAQMRYFGGYSEQEIAETLEVTERTVRRDWEKTRLILAAALR